MERPNSFLTTPLAILLGSIVVSIAILMHGGVIKMANTRTANTQTATPAPAAPNQPAQPPSASIDQVKDVFDKAVIKFGDANKKLVAVEVADPSCPYCSIAAGKNAALNKQAGSQFTLVSDGGNYVAPVPEIEKLVKEGKAAFAWIYSPGHGNGELGTKALYCAFEKNKFWEVHDLLMSAEGYDLLNEKVKNDKAKAGELADFLSPVFDSATMKACLESGKYDDRIATETSLAQSIGISGTPGFYLNATAFRGAYNYTDMESIVKSALGN